MNKKVFDSARLIYTLYLGLIKTTARCYLAAQLSNYVIDEWLFINKNVTPQFI